MIAETLIEYIDAIAHVVEFVGVLIMVAGLAVALMIALRHATAFNEAVYQKMRHIVGKSILLGLEVMIAADIMATVVTSPTLNSVLVLGLIVMIRTFLSLSLQVELEGRFPWQTNSKRTVENQPIETKTN